MFSCLMFFRNLAFPEKAKQNAIVILFYGILIELLQETITETRTSDFFDVVADAVGIGVGYGLSRLKFINKILKLNN